MVVHEKHVEGTKRPQENGMVLGFTDRDTVSADFKCEVHSGTYDARGPLS